MNHIRSVSSYYLKNASTLLDYLVGWCAPICRSRRRFPCSPPTRWMTMATT